MLAHGYASCHVCIDFDPLTAYLPAMTIGPLPSAQPPQAPPPSEPAAGRGQPARAEALEITSPPAASTPAAQAAEKFTPNYAAIAEEKLAAFELQLAGAAAGLEHDRTGFAEPLADAGYASIKAAMEQAQGQIAVHKAALELLASSTPQGLRTALARCRFATAEEATELRQETDEVCVIELCADAYALQPTDEAQRAMRRALLGLPPTADWLES